MTNEENSYMEEIERYALGEMPEDEQHAFERRLKTDASLARDLAQFRDLLLTLKLKQTNVDRMNSVREQLRDLEDSLPPLNEADLENEQHTDPDESE